MVQAWRRQRAMRRIDGERSVQRSSCAKECGVATALQNPTYLLVCGVHMVKLSTIVGTFFVAILPFAGLLV